MVNHNIVRFDISVHYTLTVTEIQGLNPTVTTSLYAQWFETKLYLKKFKYIVPNVKVLEFRVECSEICIVDVFKDQ